MKRVLMTGLSLRSLAHPSLGVIATVVTLCVAALATSGSLLAQELNGTGADPVRSQDLFYTTSGPRPDGTEVFAIQVSGSDITTRDVGPTNGGMCASLARSPSGALYSMCGALFGAQQLATIDAQTGRANLFGKQVSGLAVMAMAFSPKGTLYAVGDCNPAADDECTHGSDPNYNSLYTVDLETGAVARIGSTGAPEFFMDLAFDANGGMFGVTSTVHHSAVPAILYSIEPATGMATKMVKLVGSNSVMGLAFSREGELYATDWTQDPGLYLIDTATGFETAIAALPFGLSSGLELMNPPDDEH